MFNISMLEGFHQTTTSSVVSSQAVANILTAVGIILALILGLFGLFKDEFRALFLKPKLKLEFKKEPPFCHFVPWTNVVTGEHKHDSHYFRILVNNDGNYPFKNVEVMLANIEKRVENGSYKKLWNFIPLNLNWSHFNVINWKKIHPDLFKLFSLGFIAEYKNVAKEGLVIREKSDVLFVLDTHPKPNSGEHILFPNNDYRITLALFADNMKVKEIKIHLCFDDKWDNDEKIMYEKYVSCELI